MKPLAYFSAGSEWLNTWSRSSTATRAGIFYRDPELPVKLGFGGAMADSPWHETGTSRSATEGRKRPCQRFSSSSRSRSPERAGWSLNSAFFFTNKRKKGTDLEEPAVKVLEHEELDPRTLKLLPHSKQQSEDNCPLHREKGGTLVLKPLPQINVTISIRFLLLGSFQR